MIQVRHLKRDELEKDIFEEVHVSWITTSDWTLGFVADSAV